MTQDAVVIVGAARTPMGGMMGSLSDVRAPAAVCNGDQCCD